MFSTQISKKLKMAIFQHKERLFPDMQFKSEYYNFSVLIRSKKKVKHAYIVKYTNNLYSNINVSLFEVEIV